MPHVNEAVNYAARIDLGTGVETVSHMKLLDSSLKAKCPSFFFRRVSFRARKLLRREHLFGVGTYSL